MTGLAAGNVSSSWLREVTCAFWRNAAENGGVGRGLLGCDSGCFLVYPVCFDGTMKPAMSDMVLDISGRPMQYSNPVGRTAAVLSVN